MYNRVQLIIDMNTTTSHQHYAVIGAGISGLSISRMLSENGIKVTVFEKEANAGGMLRYGTPNYAYNKQILDEEIENLKQYGVKFVLGAEITDTADLKAHLVLHWAETIIISMHIRYQIFRA